MTIIEIRSAEEGEMPVAKNTCYKWHSMKKHPRLIYKVAGKLFFDMEEWRKMAEKAKQEQVRKARNLRSTTGEKEEYEEAV